MRIFRPAIFFLLFIASNMGPLAAQGKVYDFSLKNTDNQIVHLSDIKGEKITVIDFWATWCQPCIRSLPRLVELSEEFAEKGVNFIGISIDSPRNLAKVKPFARSMGISYPVLLDSNSELMGDLSVTAVPSLLILNEDNRILYMHEGFSAGDEEIIREEIEKSLLK